MKKIHTPSELRRIFLAVLAENLFETRNLRRILQHRLRVIGNVPDPGGPGIVLSACDEGYYARFAPHFVLSAEATGHRNRIHIHLYAPSSETLEHIDTLRRSLTHTELSYTWEERDFESYGVAAPIYYTAARYLMMYHLLVVSKAPVLCVDIDGLIRRPLDSAFDQIRSADLTIHFRLNEKKVWRRVLCAAMGANPTKPARQFLERMASSIFSVLDQRPDYHIDQTILYDMFRIRSRLRKDIRWQHLPLSWVDYDFSDDSLIWTAKAARKSDDRFRDSVAAIDQRFGAMFDALPPLLAVDP